MRVTSRQHPSDPTPPGPQGECVKKDEQEIKRVINKCEGAIGQQVSDRQRGVEWKEGDGQAPVLGF